MLPHHDILYYQGGHGGAFIVSWHGDDAPRWHGGAAGDSANYWDSIEDCYAAHPHSLARR